MRDIRAFVAEQYLPEGGAETAARGASAAKAAAEQLTREGVAVQFLQSIFIPEDETCLHLYLADSIEDVRAAAGRAALPFERVAEALSWTPGG
jgi:Nickel responsive protein SCO4226-like